MVKSRVINGGQPPDEYGFTDLMYLIRYYKKYLWDVYIPPRYWGNAPQAYIGNIFVNNPEDLIKTLNEVDKLNRTALMHAIIRQDSDIVKYIIDRVIWINRMREKSRVDRQINELKEFIETNKLIGLLEAGSYLLEAGSDFLEAGSDLLFNIMRVNTLPVKDFVASDEIRAQLARPILAYTYLREQFENTIYSSMVTPYEKRSRGTDNESKIDDMSRLRDVVPTIISFSQNQDQDQEDELKQYMVLVPDDMDVVNPYNKTKIEVAIDYSPPVDEEMSEEMNKIIKDYIDRIKTYNNSKKSGGKKRKTKKGKRGNKSKKSRKGKKSRKERKSRKGKKIKR